MTELVMGLAGVSREKAEEALAKHKEVWLAVDALMERPVVTGDKYIPQKPKVSTGLTSEQEALCLRGRWLQDQVNAVFSVAHSKVQTQPDQREALEEQHDRVPPSSPELVAVPHELPLGFGERNLPLARQSESLQ